MPLEAWQGALLIAAAAAGYVGMIFRRAPSSGGIGRAGGMLGGDANALAREAKTAWVRARPPKVSPTKPQPAVAAEPPEAGQAISPLPSSASAAAGAPAAGSAGSAAGTTATPPPPPGLPGKVRLM